MAEGTTDTQVLWQEYKRTGDRALRDRLILTYAPLVKYVAGRLGSGLPAHVEEGDLVSYGLLGLIGAIERFDPARDIKFETYAIARIKGSIIDELRSMDWVPRSVRSRARDIERAIAQLEAKLMRAPTDEEIWRYSRVDDFDPAAWRPLDPPAPGDREVPVAVRATSPAPSRVADTAWRTAPTVPARTSPVPRTTPSTPSLTRLPMPSCMGASPFCA